jgi:hypothetical protein
LGALLGRRCEQAVQIVKLCHHTSPSSSSS